MSNKLYTRPTLVEYGTLAALTLGHNGCLPDNENQPISNTPVDGNHNASPDACDDGGGGGSLGSF
jgi:hypothetical protein